MMGTPLQQACQSLNLKSVCRLIEEGEDLNKKLTGIVLPPIKIAVQAMHVELTVLLIKHGARYNIVNIGTTDNLHLSRLLTQEAVSESPFTRLNVSDQLDLYVDKLFKFFHNVQSLLSSNHLPPELQLSCCSNETCSKRCELDRDSIINSFVCQMLDLNRCDIIKLLLHQHRREFSVIRLNEYLQIATMHYRCQKCFQELQSHGADVNYLRNQPDIFDDFFRYAGYTKGKFDDHVILTALFDSDIVVRRRKHFHDLCFPQIHSKTRRLLIQQMCVKCERCEQVEKTRKKLHPVFTLYSHPSKVFAHLWAIRQWELIGIYYYAGYYPEPSSFRREILKHRNADRLNSLCHCINYTTGFMVPNEWISNSLSDSADNSINSIASIIESMTRNPRKLQNCCVISIRKAMCSNVLYRCKQLPLPEKMKKLITLDFH